MEDSNTSQGYTNEADRKIICVYSFQGWSKRDKPTARSYSCYTASKAAQIAITGFEGETNRMRDNTVGHGCR